MLLLPDWSLLIRFVRHSNVPVLRKIAASFGCLVGVGMVLVLEYQLSEVGLKLSMIAVFLAVASQLLRQGPSILADDQFTRSSLPFAPVRGKLILLPLAVLAAMVAIYMREYLIYTPPLSNMLLVTLAINTLATVSAFQISGSYFRQTEPLAKFNGVKEDHGEDEVDPALETISFQFVIALGSVLQYIGFWVALGTLLWVVRQFRPCAVDDVYYASVNGSYDYHSPGFNAPSLPEEQRSIRWSVLSQAIFAGPHHAEYQGISQCMEYTYTYRGQFIVSAQRILSQSPGLYRLLLENLIDENAMTHTEEYAKQPWLPGKEDSLNAAMFGFTMERLWGLVFGCEGKMEQCPSLMAGAVGAVMGVGGRWGGVGECQCLDGV
ncbi:hypothetical protein E4T50_12466 [Aureobasidium sp. EXF-12298]|nr:hypothetical protein E4T50_12466 [Aureobasidium sp. EXF-12298]